MSKRVEIAACMQYLCQSSATPLNGGSLHGPSSSHHRRKANKTIEIGSASAKAPHVAHGRGELGNYVGCDL